MRLIKNIKAQTVFGIPLWVIIAAIVIVVGTILAVNSYNQSNSLIPKIFG